MRSFVSYSRKDEGIVKPIVDIMRASSGEVFFDVDSIEPGKQWRQELSVAVASSSLVFIFWSRHAAKSKWVEREWTTAARLGKDLIPVLLDSTPLPTELRKWQYIDLRAPARKLLGVDENDDEPPKWTTRLTMASLWAVGGYMTGNIIDKANEDGSGHSGDWVLIMVAVALTIYLFFQFGATGRTGRFQMGMPRNKDKTKLFQILQREMAGVLLAEWNSRRLSLWRHGRRWPL